jgi:choline dehydrogenase
MAQPNRRRFLRDSAVLVGSVVLWPERTAGQGSTSDTFDFIIVGAGSSGCVIANRLTADPGVRVLLIEAGGPPGHPDAAHPGRWTTLIGSEMDWQYVTEPEPSLNGRRIAWPRGKAHGGSSAINAMSYARGHRAAYEEWAALASPAWSYRALLPTFLKSERNSRGGSEYHGANGPWVVADTRDPHAGHLAFLEAARELGFDADPAWDFDGARQEHGAGFYQKNIHEGRRHSVADAFLLPALSRPNLVVRDRAVVSRVRFDGRRAVGVDFIRDGRAETARVSREIVLAAGALETPKLLMLSGIGPAAGLKAHGVTPLVDNPDVGAHLQDHPRVSVRWHSRQTLPPSSVSAGLLTSSGSRTAAGPPDLQFYVGRGLAEPDDFITLTVALTRPISRGTLSLASADPFAPPVIRANYFAEAADLTAMVEGVRLAERLANTKAYAALRGAAAPPSADLSATSTPDQLRAFVRATAETMFHPAGTCRMGNGAGAVVDPSLRVRGVDGLRVADASIMPTVINCQCNAACVMIGERAAELIDDDGGG